MKRCRPPAKPVSPQNNDLHVRLPCCRCATCTWFWLPTTPGQGCRAGNCAAIMHRCWSVSCEIALGSVSRLGRALQRAMIARPRRVGRVVEGAPLLREYGLKAHRGFESLTLRQYVHCVHRIGASASTLGGSCRRRLFSVRRLSRVVGADDEESHSKSVTSVSFLCVDGYLRFLRAPM